MNMTRPKITFNEASKLLTPETEGFHVCIIGIRGYYKKTMGDPSKNDRGIYDDAALVFFGRTPEGFRTYNFNTDPSRQKPGMATILPGLHFFKLGKHGISRPGGGYPAFRPDTPDEGLPARRDGMVGVFRAIATNIHKGSLTSTSSEGCQTVFPHQWKEFQESIYAEMQKVRQKRLPYLLIEQ